MIPECDIFPAKITGAMGSKGYPFAEQTIVGGTLTNFIDGRKVTSGDSDLACVVLGGGTVASGDYGTMLMFQDIGQMRYVFVPMGGFGDVFESQDVGGPIVSTRYTGGLRVKGDITQGGTTINRSGLILREPQGLSTPIPGVADIEHNSYINDGEKPGAKDWYIGYPSWIDCGTGWYAMLSWPKWYDLDGNLVFGYGNNDSPPMFHEMLLYVPHTDLYGHVCSPQTTRFGATGASRGEAWGPQHASMAVYTGNDHSLSTSYYPCYVRRQDEIEGHSGQWYLYELEFMHGIATRAIKGSALPSGTFTGKSGEIVTVNGGWITAITPNPVSPYTGSLDVVVGVNFANQTTSTARLGIVDGLITSITL